MAGKTQSSTFLSIILYFYSKTFENLSYFKVAIYFCSKIL